MADDIAERLQSLQRRIARSAERSGRSPGAVTLVAVTKTVPVERIRAAYRAGQGVFGENRVQEALAKMAKVAAEMPEARWHLIGHLQSNKANSAAEAFSLIESVDSVRLACLLDGLASRLGRRLPVLFEVNVAGEASKSGFSPDVFRDAISELLSCSHLEPRGLMTVAPLVEDAEQVRSVFRALRELRDEVCTRCPSCGLRELSMGMTNDFEVAIEEGATMVRIGRALFGERPVVPGKR